MRAGRVALIIAGVFVALIGFGLMAGGGVLVWAHATQRDAQGFYTTPVERFDTSTYALTSGVNFGARPERDDFVWWSRGIGTVKLQATAAAGKPLFIGVARRADVDRWLSGSAYERVTNLHFGPFRTETLVSNGELGPTAPTTQTFWVESTAGTGTQTLRWPAESGRWSVVVMNADGSRGVSADMSVGIKTGLVLPIGLGVGGFGLLMALGGLIMLIFGVRGLETVDVREGAGGVAPVPMQPVPGAYPARLDGRLEPVSRWLWLVKVFLVIPHAIALAFLWAAWFVLTVVAGFAILFTGQYPRSIFDFNLGVMRWTWRVAYYTVGAFGTDKYPPFSLASDPAYPADFNVAYPEQLSRGLVLVKWWLLALPHYLIVGVLAGGWGWAAGDHWRFVGSGGLIGLLAFIAVVTTMFRGSYPDTLFDFVMGLNRWVYRVMAYAGLMTDEYPPFRLDTGGADPGSMPVIPPPPPPDAASSAGEPELVGTPR